MNYLCKQYFLDHRQQLWQIQNHKALTKNFLDQKVYSMVLYPCGLYLFFSNKPIHVKFEKLLISNIENQ